MGKEAYLVRMLDDYYQSSSVSSMSWFSDSRRSDGDAAVLGEEKLGDDQVGAAWLAFGLDDKGFLKVHQRLMTPG